MALLSSPDMSVWQKMPEFKLKDLNNNLINSENLENYDGHFNFFYMQSLPICKSSNKTISINLNRVRKI